LIRVYTQGAELRREPITACLFPRDPCPLLFDPRPLLLDQRPPLLDQGPFLLEQRPLLHHRLRECRNQGTGVIVEAQQSITPR